LETYADGIHPRYQFENYCSSSGGGKFTTADEDDYSDSPDNQGFRRWRKGGKWAKAYHIPTLGFGSWDPAAKAHMMAYDKQLKDFRTMYESCYLVTLRIK
jgi:hypothetical protein